MLVAIFRGIVFRGDDQTATFASATIDRFDNVDEFLSIFQSPTDLIVITSAQIDHDVFISVEEHHCTRIVQFVPRRDAMNERFRRESLTSC